MYKIYKGDSVVVEGESPLTITNIEPNTEVTTGEYQAVRVDGDNESERVDIPGFSTLPESPEPESVSISPMNNNLSETGVRRQLTATIEPPEADQTVTWSSEDDGVCQVDADGLLLATGAGTTTITATAVNGVQGISTVNVAGA